MALTGPLGAGRQIQTATLLADGRVVIAGGFDFADLPLASASLYDPATNTSSPTGSMTAARGLYTATLLSSGRVLIAGGGPASWIHPGPYLASAELFDPQTGTFSPTGSMTTTREAQTATRLNDGRVLIAGGSDAGEHAVASAELYDPKTGTFSPTGSMTTARAFHTATLLSDGRVLITGGDSGSWTSGPMFASAEIYNPTTGTFSATGPMTSGRAWHTATLLSDGRVLMTGGVNTSVDLATAELYDPKTGAFTPTGSMEYPRIYQTATLLSDGRVLVAGGGEDYTNGNFLASAELYDPKTGTFSVTGSMAEARTYQTANVALRRPRPRHRWVRRPCSPCLGRALRPKDRHVQSGGLWRLTAVRDCSSQASEPPDDDPGIVLLSASNSVLFAQGSAQGSARAESIRPGVRRGGFTRGRWSRHSDLNRGPAVYETAVEAASRGFIPCLDSPLGGASTRRSGRI